MRGGRARSGSVRGFRASRDERGRRRPCYIEGVNLPPLTPTARKLIIFMVIAYVSVACLEVAGVHLVPLLSLNLTLTGCSRTWAWRGSP